MVTFGEAGISFGADPGDGPTDIQIQTWEDDGGSSKRSRSVNTSASRARVPVATRRFARRG